MVSYGISKVVKETDAVSKVPSGFRHRTEGYEGKSLLDSNSICICLLDPSKWPLEVTLTGGKIQIFSGKLPRRTAKQQSSGIFRYCKGTDELFLTELTTNCPLKAFLGNTDGCKPVLNKTASKNLVKLRVSLPRGSPPMLLPRPSWYCIWGLELSYRHFIVPVGRKNSSFNPFNLAELECCLYFFGIPKGCEGGSAAVTQAAFGSWPSW